MTDSRYFLSQAAKALSSSRSSDDALARTLAVALPTLGDFAFFDIVDGESVRRTARAHEDDAIEVLLKATPLPLQEHVEACLSGLSTAAMHVDLDDAWYRKMARSPAQLSLMRRLAFTSMLTVPVRFRGETIGAMLLFMSRSGRRHSPEQLESAQDLAALSGAVVANARLLDQYARSQSALQTSQRRLELLAAASSLLSSSLEPAITLQRLGEVLTPAVADWCRIDLLDGDGALVRGLAYNADPERTQRATQAVTRLRGLPETVGSMAWCVRTGESYTVNYASPEGFAATGDPALLEFARSIGMHALSITPLVARGRTLGALAILQAESRRGIGSEDAALLRDIAQRAALAIDNARLYSDANAARQQAELANRAKDEFLAMLGHELRNPLAPIVSTLKVMALRDDSAFSQERRVIERQVGNLARLVDDLLDVARIARGDVRLRRERVKLGDILTRAAEMAAPLIELRRHTLRLAQEPGTLWLDADAGRLNQVFANLLTNAARYTPEGGEIAVAAHQDGSQCVVTVADNGQGIEPDLLPRIFDLFVQGQQDLQRAGGGLGVGLALVKNLVGLHGGSVSAESAGRGSGSTFKVVLPLAAAAALETEPTLAPNVPSRPLRSERVLVVDDNRDAAEALVALLEVSGCDVRMATDPIVALALLEEFSPDVAILDIGLPQIDGYALATRIRSLDAGRSCRLLALTGYGMPEDRARSEAAGFSAHLVKPVELEALLDAMRRVD